MDEPFYAEGLSFECTRCSACCRGGPGYVFLSVQDLKRILAFLALDFRSFLKDYCILVDIGTGAALSLAERENFDCVFWGRTGCSIYSVRPIQCSTYPFWSAILENHETWMREAGDCTGIDRGEHHSRGDIEDSLLRRRKAGTIVFDRETLIRPEAIDENSLLGS